MPYLRSNNQLTDTDMATYFTTIEKTDGRKFTFYRANQSAPNGNSRMIVHFMDFLTDEERSAHTLTEVKYAIAERRAKIAHFKVYRGRDFGGGFVRQYDYCNCQMLHLDIITAIKTDLSR